MAFCFLLLSDKVVLSMLAFVQVNKISSYVFGMSTRTKEYIKILNEMNI